jgi:hypothetical protein
MIRRPRNRGLLIQQTMRTSQQWWIQRSGTLYRFIRDMGGGGEYLSYDFWPLPVLSGDSCTMIGQARIGLPMLSVDDTMATYSGTFTHGSDSAVTEGYKARAFTDGAMTAASTALTVTDGTFVAGDVGTRVVITGAGAAGANLTANITVVTNATHVTLGSSAGTTVSGAAVSSWPSYHYSTAAGATATWISPVSINIGARICKMTVGGLWAVAIDASTTAANLCRTAQQVVDEGSYPSTILVANGGTLSPTDRVINCYATSTSWDFPLAIASGLASATHTVVLTATGYTRTGTSGVRAYITGFCYAAGTETPTTTSVDILSKVTTQPSYSAHEGVEAIYPYGTSSYTDYIGRVHGYEVEDSLAFVIDGTPTTITDGTTVSAGTVTVINQVSHVKHPAYGGGTAHLEDVVSTFTLHSEGLDIEQAKTINAHATMVGGYPAMLPADGVFDRFTQSGTFGPVTVNAGDGTHKAGSTGGAWIAVMWTSGDNYAASLEVGDFVSAMGAGYTNPPNLGWYVEDRAPVSGTKLNKTYAPWAALGTALYDVPAGTVWHWKSRYRWTRFAAGAETALASI